MGVPFIPLDSPPAKTMTTLSEDNRIVQGLWVGGRLSALERLCIRSFCAHGHEFHLYHYDELHNVPRVDGLRLANGEEILPRTAIFRYYRDSLAGFADRFRWELMNQKGGWYADMDTVCLRPLDFAAQTVMGREAEGGKINSALMKFPRGHLMAAAMAGACAHINRFTPWDTPKTKWRKIRRRILFRREHKYLKWGEAGGPLGTTAAAEHFGMRDYVLPAYSLYAQNHPLARNFFNDSLHKHGVLDVMLSGVYALHIMNSHLAAAEKDGSHPQHSPYEILKRRYGEAEE